MADREKIIKDLTDLENVMTARQEICPREEVQYWIELQESLADALELLKEQQNRIDVLRSEVKRLDADVVRCKDCKKKGQSVYREDGTEYIVCWNHGYGIQHPADFFCADGEKRE